MARRALMRALAPAVLGLLALTAAPGVSFASCLPPQIQTWMDTLDTVVIGGSIVAVEPSRVLVDVAQWWGKDPQARVTIDRPASDPTVITSIDWNPQPGEGWIIVAKRVGERLETAACQQFPADLATVREVVSSLGDPVAPTASVEPAAPTAAPTSAAPSASVEPAAPTTAPTGAAPWSAFLVVVLAVGAAVLVGAAWIRRRVDHRA